MSTACHISYPCLSCPVKTCPVFLLFSRPITSSSALTQMNKTVPTYLNIFYKQEIQSQMCSPLMLGLKLWFTVWKNSDPYKSLAVICCPVIMHPLSAPVSSTLLKDPEMPVKCNLKAEQWGNLCQQQNPSNPSQADMSQNGHTVLTTKSTSYFTCFDFWCCKTSIRKLTAKLFFPPGNMNLSFPDSTVNLPL